MTLNSPYLIICSPRWNNREGIRGFHSFSTFRWWWLFGHYE